jgi:uncharacterized membrane protein HdeD (DUF308 family)
MITFDSVGLIASTRIDHWPRRFRLGTVILGIVPVVVGYLSALPLIWSIGVIVLLIGVVCLTFGATGHAVGGRRHIFQLELGASHCFGLPLRYK